MGILANLIFGNRADRKADIPALVKDGALVIDVRTPGEYAGGHVENAVNIPHNLIARDIAGIESDKSRSIIVYCHSGGRSAAAGKALEQAGYMHVVNGGSLHRMQMLLSR
jgi:phage shock protein E